MILKMGNTDERFSKALFDGKNMDKSTFKITAINKSSVYRHILNDHMQTSRYVEDSNRLTSLQKRMIKKGLVI